MEFKSEKLVRFYRSEGNSMLSWEKNNAPHTAKLNARDASAPYLKQGIFTSAGKKRFDEDDRPWSKCIFDPGSEIILLWNNIFLMSCLVALLLDPLYFYLPSLRISASCMDTDLNLGIVVTIFRTIADVFYFLHMLIKFRIAYVAPSSRVFGRGELVMDPKKIAVRYLKSDFCIDLVAALPLPQMVIWFVIPAVRGSNSDHANNALAMIVLFQYFPRLYLIFPLSAQIVKATGVVTKTAWAGAAYNLLLYMIASNLLGASWYLLSIERQTTCWKKECRNDSSSICEPKFLYCKTSGDSAREAWKNGTNVFTNCNPNNSTFNYGIFGRALTDNIVSSKFLEKYFYCLWWGLQQLSSYGQNLETSTFIGETAFCILISIVGLVLFAHLIGNMQTYLQSLTVRIEEWRVKRKDTEEWMRHRQLPPALQNRVRRFIQYKWIVTQGVEEESLLSGLPTDLRRDIQRQLCLDLVRRVPFFSQMDDQLLDAICERLVSSLSTEGTYIVREGDPVTEMLFIIRGQLESSTTNGGRTGFFNSTALNPGDFCGEELLSWALLPKSTGNLPSSTRTVRALSEVEAFALRAEDLKFVANQFRRLHSRKLQHTFRFYSHQWRAWAACFIQAAWRSYKKRKLARELIMQESYVLAEQEEEDEEMQMHTETAPEDMPDATQNDSLRMIASRFAANARKGAQKIKSAAAPSLPGQLPKLQKPDEPDFSREPEEED
ncbi:putative cyclic nucleotide-gated ion channel 14 [Nymphaea thermarum]|nr:putative cyclic nucleotide-gated ion channel 14 [Nymphaea thermarum]